MTLHRFRSVRINDGMPKITFLHVQIRVFLHFYPLLFWQIKILPFHLRCEGKIKILRGYCGGKSPNWYIGPWALFKNMDTSEDEQMISKGSECGIM